MLLVSCRDSQDKQPVEVKKHKDGSVEVKIPHLGVSVRSDGRKVSIKVCLSFALAFVSFI